VWFQQVDLVVGPQYLFFAHSLSVLFDLFYTSGGPAGAWPARLQS
jgi:hypothetical protein